MASNELCCQLCLQLCLHLPPKEALASRHQLAVIVGDWLREDWHLQRVDQLEPVSVGSPHHSQVSSLTSHRVLCHSLLADR